MSDGANMGITAGRALDTIIGGEGQPTEEEKMTAEQVKERILAAPSPLEGKPIWEREDVDGDQKYSLAADCIAKAFILAEAEKPGILTTELYYPDPYEPFPSLSGKKKDSMDAVWEYISEKWEGFDDWIGGASGFMVGFAYNTALYINDMPTGGNPALLTIGTKEDDE